MEVNVTLDEGLEGTPPGEEWLRHVVQAALSAEMADLSSEVSLLITGQEKVRELNRSYLDEDRPTDVLSFPMTGTNEAQTAFVTPPDGMRHLGEVIVSLPQAAIQAQEHGHSTEREMAILIIHGVLHLLGYDHAEPGEEQAMKAREADILSLIGDGGL